MNNLTITNEKNIQSNLTIPSKNLPTEILMNIFKHLNKRDLQSTATVNWHWKAVSLETEIQLVKDFTKFLEKHLTEETNLKEIKNCIDGFIEKKSQGSLKDVQKTVNNFKDQFENILKKISEEEFNALKKTSRKENKPLFFDTIFALTSINKKIDKLRNSNIDQMEPPIDGATLSELCNLTTECVKHDFFDTAIEVANLTSIENIKNYILEHISVQCVLQGKKIKQAKTLANLIMDEEAWSKALQEISICSSPDRGYRGNFYSDTEE